MPPFAVLQVCMGNICRSPMAERLLVLALGDRADLVLVGSTGTGGWHVGGRMDPSASRQLRARGASDGGFRARKLAREHIEAADLILTATAEQLAFVQALAVDAADRTFVLGEFGRLLRAVDLSALPPAGPDDESVYARGVALVAAAAAARGGRAPEPGDDLADPYGRDDRYFGRVADQIEATVRPLATALLGTVSAAR